MEAQPTTEHERECLVEIIAPKEQIRKFFFERHFDFLTSVPQRRLQEMILCSRMKGNSGKMTDFGENSTAHRTTYVHFLAKGRWDDKQLEETQNVRAFRQFWNFLTSMGRPSLSVLMIQFCPKQRHLQKRNGQHRELDGTILIWKARTSGPCCHRWNRRYFTVLFPEMRLPRTW